MSKAVSEPRNYQHWLQRVDAAVWQLAGCSVHDLADCCLADWYDSGMRPQTAARKVIRYDTGMDE